MADTLPHSASGEQETRGRYYVSGAGAVFLIVLGIPLYAEFNVPGNAAWNVFLIMFLAGIAVGGFLLQRFFFQHAGEIGEARFDTRNKSDLNG
jgi:RsiW-degrading membrane proteinase PrsW (M82 family)